MKDIILTLYAKGWTNAAIAKKLRVNHTTVWRVTAKAKAQALARKPGRLSQQEKCDHREIVNASQMSAHCDAWLKARGIV